MCLKNRGGFSEGQTITRPPKGTLPSAASNAELPMRQHGDSTANQPIFCRLAYFESRAAVLSLATKVEHFPNHRYRLDITQKSQSPQPKSINHCSILQSESPSKTQKHIQKQLISSLYGVPLPNYPFSLEIPEDSIHPRFILEA